MNRKESPSPLGATLLLFALPAMALVLGAVMLVTADRARSEAAAAQGRLAAAMVRPAEDPDLQAARLLVPGETAGLGAAALQAVILERVQSPGLTVQQIESNGVAPEGALMRLRATLRLQGSEAQIMSAVMAIEGAEPLLFIDRLEFRGQGQEDGAINAELAISAYAGPFQP